MQPPPAELATARPRERRRHRREERVEQVLDAAVGVFAERGFHEASMDEIAERAGVSKPILYTHFESKDGLYEATLERADRLLTERVRASAELVGTAEERLWAGILAFVDVVAEHRDWWLVARKAAVGEGSFAELGRRQHNQMAELIRNLFSEAAAAKGIAGGAITTIEPLAHAFVGACETMAFWWADRPEVPKGTIAILLMNLTWMGLGDLIEANVWLPPSGQNLDG
jgi:AcrR family transcriptional regulator